MHTGTWVTAQWSLIDALAFGGLVFLGAVVLWGMANYNGPRK